MWLLMNLLVWSEEGRSLPEGVASQRKSAAPCPGHNNQSILQQGGIHLHLKWGRRRWFHRLIAAISRAPAQEDVTQLGACRSAKRCPNPIRPVFCPPPSALLPPFNICWMLQLSVWVPNLCLSSVQGCKWSTAAPGNTWQEVVSPVVFFFSQ